MEISANLRSMRAEPTEKRLRDAAVELEATFLTEMLKSAGVGQVRQSFGGGAGEDQFSSFLVRQQATQMAKAGGVGLSEIFFKAMMEKAYAE